MGQRWKGSKEATKTDFRNTEQTTWSKGLKLECALCVPRRARKPVCHPQDSDKSGKSVARDPWTAYRPGQVLNQHIHTNTHNLKINIWG